MSKGKILNFIVVVGLLLVPLGFAKNVSADDFDGMDTIMTISPPKQKIILTPGEVYNGAVTVLNATTSLSELKYSASVGSFTLGKDENGKIDYGITDVDTTTTYNQMTEWITLGKTSGTLSQGKSEEVPFTIKVPNDAPAGGQYASIVITNNTGVDDYNKGGVSIVSEVRFASLIYAVVTGETKEDGEILENNIPSFLLNNQLDASSTVKNSGNVHTDAEYTLQIWPLFSDEEVYTNEEKPETNTILPDTERYHMQSHTLPSIGIFKVRQTVKIFDKSEYVEKLVIFCPLWLLFVILFVIIALIIWVVMRAKKRKSSRKDDE